MAAFVQYIPRGVAGLRSGMEFMDTMRTKGEEIEAAALKRQAADIEAGLLKSGFSEPLKYNTAGDLVTTPSTLPVLTPTGEVLPAYNPPAVLPMKTTPTAAEPAAAPAPAPAPAAEDATGKPKAEPAPSQVGKVENTLGIPVVPTGEEGSPLSRWWTGQQAQGVFARKYIDTFERWMGGAYGNPSQNYIASWFDQGDTAIAARKKTGEVSSWLSKPETLKFFEGNLAAFEELVANPGAAYDKYKDVIGQVPAAQPAQPAQPAAPGTPPAPAATQPPATGERVGGQGVVVPPGTVIQPTPANPTAGVGPDPAVRKLSESFIANKAVLIQQFPTLLQNPKLGAIVRDAKRVGVPPAAAIAINGMESEFGRVSGVSPVGAIGDWQVMPQTRIDMLKFFGNAEELKRRGVADADNLVAITTEIQQLEAESKSLAASGNPDAAAAKMSDANRLTGLLRLRYNAVIGVPIELWGAAYQAPAEEVLKAGAPINAHDGKKREDGTREPGVLNEAYNNVYVGAFNAASQYIAQTNLVGGEQVVTTNAAGQPVGVVPPKLEGVRGVPPEIGTLETKRLALVREQTISAAQGARARLDNNFNAEMQAAQAKRDRLLAKVEAARRVGNATMMQTAADELATFDTSVREYTQKYEAAAADIQASLNAAVIEADTSMTDVVVGVAMHSFTVGGNIAAYEQTHKAITGNDIRLQETGRDDDGNPLYAVFTPDNKTGELKLFQRNVSAVSLADSLWSLTSSKKAAEIAETQKALAGKQFDLQKDIVLKRLDGEIQKAVEQTKGDVQMMQKLLEKQGTTSQVVGDGLAVTVTDANNRSRTVLWRPQADNQGNVTYVPQDLSAAMQPGLNVPPAPIQ